MVLPEVAPGAAPGKTKFGKMQIHSWQSSRSESHTIGNRLGSARIKASLLNFVLVGTICACAHHRSMPIGGIDLENPKFAMQGEGYITLTTQETRTSFDANSSEQRTFEGLPEALVGKESCDHAPGGTERIAIAEDDIFIRRTIQCHLKSLGYQVEVFANGGEVLAVMSQARPPFAALVTDHEMPGLTGYELARRIRTDHSQVRVLLMSGCPKDSIFPDAEPEDWPPFLRKPYTLDTLARTLRDVIDGPAPDQH